jgi:prephenate dehydratase
VLFKALSCFALRGIDMTKIERRACPTRPDAIATVADAARRTPQPPDAV